MADELEKAGSAPDDGPPRRLPIVGVGASAGGVKALTELFGAMPGGLGAAFVVIVHLDPDAHSELPAILATRSVYKVLQVTGSVELEADHVYVIPPDRQLSISDHEIAAVPFDEPRGHRAPIDLFFCSLAAQKGDGCAVILTGAGSDGAVGVKAIKEAGGIVLVQDPDEAEYASMPRSAIATEVADFVLPIGALAERLVELVRIKRHLAPAGTAEEHDVLRRILAHLRVRTGHDFAHYKKTTVLRRVRRRMQVARVDTLGGYFEYLREHGEESQSLLADLLISVTTFFRDPAAFDVLAKKVIPRFFADRDGEGVRVWVAGCATGEEAYSLGILFLEEAARHEFRTDIQIFASDIDSAALAVGREGRYPAAIAAQVSEERLRKFFTEDGEYYRVKRELRDMVLFAGHSLLKDPPFSRLDLVSCRNLLIYLDREMQQQVLTTLHYGLKPDGYAFLGGSESAETPAGYFRAVDRDVRIFRSTGRSRDQLPALPRVLPPPLLQPPAASPEPRRTASSQTFLDLHRQALEAAAPPSILVDRTCRVVHLSENAGRYLLSQAGPLSSDVNDLVRPELRLELRSALHRAFERNEQTLSAALFVQFNGAAHRTYIQVKPVPHREGERGAERALVVFIDSGAEDGFDADGAGEPSDRENVRRLQQEIEMMQSRLRTTREESEATNEELRAANEELQSINEEYRSTAEELETSREEMQSINEELQTVNSEMKLKLDAVSRANSDLLNLMASSDVGTLFLSPELRIKRFTPSLADLFSITPADVGRPITDFSHRLDYHDLAEDARRVLRDLTPVEREIRNRDGAWYVLRLRPYRTLEDKIDGIVATFVDVTERRRMEDALRRSEQQLQQEMRLVELSRAAIFVWDFDGPILQWNRGSEELYGYTREEALGRERNELLRTVTESSSDDLRAVLLSEGSWKGELRQFSKGGVPLVVESQIELQGANGRRCALESTRDVTQSKMLEARQELLLSELTHRVKNLLTVVQGIVHQTRRNSSSIDEFERKLDGRVTALANAQRLLLQSAWQGAEMEELIEQQVAPHLGEDRSRLHLEGPAVALAPDIATPFGLVLHELATNAAKYGALSGRKGSVSLHWHTLQRNGAEAVEVVWHEQDGPAVKQGGHAGFGSRLIAHGIPGATVRHEFVPDGVRCTLEFPVSGTGRAAEEKPARPKPTSTMANTRSQGAGPAGVP